jgi:hypothetical protein
MDWRFMTALNVDLGAGQASKASPERGGRRPPRAAGTKGARLVEHPYPNLSEAPLEYLFLEEERKDVQ